MSLSFLAPQFLWALSALPAIVLVHFLRTRRRSRVVSALFLWRRARQAADSRRRFSPTWLLLLQLLFAALAALALARPALSFEGPPDRVLVVDASASMLARDSDGGRLAKARNVAESLLTGAGRVALIRAGLDAEVVATLGDEPAAVRRSLAGLRAGDRDADLLRALELAAAVAPSGEVHLIGDAPPPSGDFTFHSVHGDAINYGITAFDTSIGQAYLAVSSNDPRPQEMELVLLRDGVELARTTLLVPARGQANATFPLDGNAGLLEARIRPPGHDALALDDLAFAGQRGLEVVVEEESAPVIRGLEALPGVQARVRGDARRAAAEVRVLFGDDNEELPPGNLLLFASPETDPQYLRIRDWAQGDELLRFVDLRETIVAVNRDAVASEEAGWQILARVSDLTPVLSRRRVDGSIQVRAAFHPSQTDLVLRPAFPALIANIMDSFRAQSTVPLGGLLPEGSTLEGRAAERALVPAVYAAPEGPVAASLLSPAETRLPTPGAAAAGGAARGAPAGPVEATRGLWLLLLVAAFLLLLVEWLAWSRGMAGGLR